MKAVGIDIGTTTICGVLLDGGTGELLDSRTLSNDTAVRTENDWEHLQDPEKILEKCRRILEAFQDGEEDIVSVGVTGQMHGILYTDVGGQGGKPSLHLAGPAGRPSLQREPQWKRRDLGGRTFPEDRVSGGLRIRSCDSLLSREKRDSSQRSSISVHHPGLYRHVPGRGEAAADAPEHGCKPGAL